MKKKIKGILFDLDGVLVDTAKYHYQAWSTLASSLGFRFSEEDNEKLKGVSRRASLEILLSMGNVSLSEEQMEDAMIRKNNEYVSLISRSTPDEILPGALELLKELKAAGIKTALGSASKNAPLILERTGLINHLDAVVDGNRTSRAKPDPEVFLLGAAALGLSPEECVVFEDAAAGIEAGIRGGMRTVGIGSPEQLGKANVVYSSLDGISWPMIRDTLEELRKRNPPVKSYIKHDPWKIIEEGFDPAVNRISESLCSLGNGHMGQRGNFEEAYSGDSLQGSYMAGVYYPDKTIVGWWKNGYPEYFAKVLNAPDWMGLSLSLDGREIDLARWKIQSFRRVLDMRRGLLHRRVILEENETLVELESRRFVSLVRPEIGCYRYTLRLLRGKGELKISSFINGNIRNEDANYDEYFWEHRGEELEEDSLAVVLETKKTGFTVATRTATRLYHSRGDETTGPLKAGESLCRPGWAGRNYIAALTQGDRITIEKYAACLTDRDHRTGELLAAGKTALAEAVQTGFDVLLKEQEDAWAGIWEHSDIVIHGDTAAQQGIRFNIFQLKQTYTGRDERLNIGPKGFTGEKYGGASYWDTEAYCLPFFLGTADPSLARQLLVYRHRHLKKAIENAGKLGFTDGAALYPMVTMNGEECHNEWEITFEEIHRNGAIAFAIHDYIRCTGDRDYLMPMGMEVLAGIARFWAQRVNWSEARKKYVILGVTGPNEYENNVHNNWYTNYLAAWCLRYAADCADFLEAGRPDEYKALAASLNLRAEERESFREIASQIYLPEDPERGICLQQDGYLDKAILPASELHKEDRPLNQNWSWDRILRSCYIKQADVLQGFFFFEDDFDRETLKRNFDFYEPLTVHESSLSPCVHTILAEGLGYEEKAYEMYLRTARLDLDDYNNDTGDGCHITSMAGTWMSVVMGFGGLRYREGELYLNPSLPSAWESYSFIVMNRSRPLKVSVEKDAIVLENRSSSAMTVHWGRPGTAEVLTLAPGEQSRR